MNVHEFLTIHTEVERVQIDVTRSGVDVTLHFVDSREPWGIREFVEGSAMRDDFESLIASIDFANG